MTRPAGTGLRPLGWPCPTSEQMREIDRDAIEKRGVPSRVLMENAGRAVVAAIRRHFPQVRRPLVLCGSGNNGGDGFVVARVLRETVSSCEPRVVCFGEPERRSPETAANYDLLSAQGGACMHAPSLDPLTQLVGECDLIVDALFGVGLVRDVEGKLADVLARLNETTLPCVAVDVPSGLCATTGRVLGVALRADVTVTIGLPKLGLAITPGSGSLLVADIGFPRASYTSVDVQATLLSAGGIAASLPVRRDPSHKGSYGHCLVVGGSLGKTGAPMLAARGAMRSGAGLVTIAVPATLQPTVAAQTLEAMTLALPDTGAGALDTPAARVVGDALETRHVLVLGPGLGTAPQTREAVLAILASARCPVVVDADALNAVGTALEGLASDHARILTPHPGEAARLLGCAPSEVQRDRVEAVRRLARRSAGLVVLKGARTLIGAPDGRIWINPTGGPGLAAGGTGDVLAGMIGAFLAQGLDAVEAAAVGVFLHGRAGERQPVGLLAREVADGVPEVWQSLQSAQECPDVLDSLVRVL